MYFEFACHWHTYFFLCRAKVNTTQLTCRFGREIAQGHFLTHQAVLCFSPPIYGKNYINSINEKVFSLSVSNNAVDYVFFGDFTYSSSTPSGTYQAGTEGNNTLLNCPRGAYCNGLMENNFTICDPGTYQPLAGQSHCIQCPVGYVCNDFGMSVPRICPAHYVCDEKGMDKAKPCPTNFLCDRGTATLSTACLKSFDFGAETCFDNSTDDFGLQASKYPAHIWAERHLMPLDEDASTSPIRGRFCLDNSCLAFEDSDNFQVFDKSFDYSSTGFTLRRPKQDISPSSRVCSKGHYCRLGECFFYFAISWDSQKANIWYLWWIALKTHFDRHKETMLGRNLLSPRPRVWPPPLWARNLQLYDWSGEVFWMPNRLLLPQLWSLRSNHLLSG